MIKAAPTWIRNPQDPADEHAWTEWFADPGLFRNARFDPFRETWQGPADVVNKINDAMGLV